MATYVTTLKDVSGENVLFPKTSLKAIMDENGNFLDPQISASDINALRDSNLASSVRHSDEVPGVSLGVNADRLNGHADSYFATEVEADNIRGNAAAYDASSSYVAGDYVTQNGILYKCLEATTGTWDNTKWIRVDLSTLETYSGDAVFRSSDALSAIVPLNADQLNGHPDTYFATASGVGTWSNTVSFTFSKGTGYVYYNPVLKIVVVSWNATTSGTSEFNVDISSLPAVGQFYGAFRGDGYMSASGNTLKVVNNFGNYAVGQIVYLTT